MEDKKFTTFVSQDEPETPAEGAEETETPSVVSQDESETPETPAEGAEETEETEKPSEE